MSDINYWLAQKYNILGEHGAAAQTAANAQMVEAQSRANVLAPAQAGSLGAEAAKNREQAKWLGPAAQAGIAETQASTAFKTAEGGMLFNMDPNTGQPNPAGLFRPASSGMVGGGWASGGGGVVTPPATIGGSVRLSPGAESRPLAEPSWNAFGGDTMERKQERQSTVPYYAKGTSKVPHKGGGKGMVKAKLAPGEAVLSPGAAEHMGRDNIGMLNALAHHGALSSQGGQLGGQPHAVMPQSIGAIQGMPPPGAGGPPGFAKGTSNVQQAVGDNGTKMGAEPKAKGFEYARGYAKGTSNVQGDDGIGRQVKLGKGKEKSPPELSLAKGTSKVPGKPTHPSKDTVNAELPPGGAVLTNDAANHVGRGMIAHLNQLHAGMPH